MVDKIITAVFALAALIFCGLMWYRGEEPPQPLLVATGVLVGRFIPTPGGLFGGKSQKS